MNKVGFVGGLLVAVCVLCVRAAAQDVPDGYAPVRAPINQDYQRHEGYQTQNPVPSPAPVQNFGGYQAPEGFEIKTPEMIDGTGGGSGSGSFGQGYVPSEEDIEAQKQEADVEEVEVPQGEPEFTKKAILVFTDKISARSSKMTVGVPSQFKVQTFNIDVQKCQIEPKDVYPEHAVRMEIFVTEDVYGNPSDARIFAGWMYKNRPSLTHITHPHVDVALVECISSPETKPKPKPKDTAKNDVKVPVAPPTPSTEQPEVRVPDEAAASAPSLEPVPQEDPEAIADKAVDAVNKALEADAEAVSVDQAQPEAMQNESLESIRPAGADANARPDYSTSD